MRGEGIRVGFEADVAVGVQDFVFVERAFAKVGDEDVPDAALRVEAHDVAAAVPEVEVADDGYAPRVRRPDAEIDPGDAVVVLDQMRAEFFIRTQVRAFGQQPVVKILQGRGEAVGVFDDHFLLAVLHFEQVMQARVGVQCGDEEAALIKHAHLCQHFFAALAALAVFGEHAHRVRPRQEYADDEPVTAFVRAEVRERVGEGTGKELVYQVFIYGCHFYSSYQFGNRCGDDDCGWPAFADVRAGGDDLPQQRV